MCLLSCVQLFVTPWTAACQAPLSMEILQARKLERVTMPSSRGSFQPGDQTQVSRIAGRTFTIWATREAQEYWKGSLSLLQGIFSTQESNQGLLYCWQILYQWSYQGTPTGAYCSIIYCCLVKKSCPLWTLCDPRTAVLQASLAFAISQSLIKLMSIESVMPYNHLILCHPLLLLPSIFPSIRVFSNESALDIKWPKYWSFTFSINPSNEYSGLISFRINWFDPLVI